LTISDFGSVKSAPGKKQLTHKGWPLHYFAPVVNGTNTQETKNTARSIADINLVKIS